MLELVLLILNICFHHREKRKQNRLLDRGIHYSAIELKFCATFQPTRKKATAEVRLISLRAPVIVFCGLCHGVSVTYATFVLFTESWICLRKF